MKRKPKREEVIRIAEFVTGQDINGMDEKEIENLIDCTMSIINARTDDSAFWESQKRRDCGLTGIRKACVVRWLYDEGRFKNG